MSSATSSTIHGVSEISAHEEAEQARVQSAKNACMTKEAASKKQYADDERRIEKEERDAAGAELQIFGAEEIPRILQAGEAARTKAVSDIDAHARTTMASELNTVVKKACSQTFSF